MPTLPLGGTSSGSGGGLHFRKPPDLFSAATLALARTARDTYFGAPANVSVSALAEFQEDESLAIIVSVTGATTRTFETYLGEIGEDYDSSGWVERTDAVQGNTGPGPSNAQLTANIKPFARIGGGRVPEPEIDPTIMRDAELTATSVMTLLGLTQAELDGLFTGARITNNNIVFTENDLGVTTLPLPVGENADGVITSFVISDDGITAVITRSEGANLNVSIPAILRAGGTTETRVRELIVAANHASQASLDLLAERVAALEAGGVIVVPPTTDTLYFGTSDTDMPQSSDLTIPGVNGTGTIPAYAGEKHLLIAKLASEPPITRVTFSDDSSNTNSIGAFTLYSNTIIPPGETEEFTVLISNQMLIQPHLVVITVS